MALSSSTLTVLPENRWIGAFVVLPVLLGFLIWLVPVHYLLVLMIITAVAIYLALYPDKCFYLFIFTIPFTERIRVLPISFSLNDLMLFFCAAITLGHMVLKGEFVNLKTKLDPGLLALTILFFLAGIFSESARGSLAFLKFFEAVVAYYLMVYLLRTRYVTRSTILKTMLATVLFQATLGIAQSFTGKLGAEFMSNRGYLGYLGLGTSTVWHGKGTMNHFNTLGYFLTISFLFYVPLALFVIRKKTWAYLAGGILLLGIITTYSRGSLLELVTGILFFLAITQPSIKKALWIMAGVALVVLPFVLFFGNSSYMDTLSFNERLMVWQVPLTAITQNAKTLWLGNGLNSYEVVAWPYIPANVPLSDYHNWFAHNYYLLAVLEMGLVGAAVLFSFLIYLWRDTWRSYKSSHGYKAVISLSLCVSIFSIFFASIFDHTYGSPYFQIYLFLLLGLLYVRPQSAGQQI